MRFFNLKFYIFHHIGDFFPPAPFLPFCKTSIAHMSGIFIFSHRPLKLFIFSHLSFPLCCLDRVISLGSFSGSLPLSYVISMLLLNTEWIFHFSSFIFLVYNFICVFIVSIFLMRFHKFSFFGNTFSLHDWAELESISAHFITWVIISLLQLLTSESACFFPLPTAFR